MKICPRCGAQAQNDARFCKGCAYNFSASDVDATVPMGQAQTETPSCPNCGSPVIPGAKICTNCAAPLAGGTMVEANFNYGGQGQGYGGQGYGAGYAGGYAGGYAQPSTFGGSKRNVIIISSIVGGVVLIGLIILIIVLASGGSGPGSIVKEAVRAVENNDDSKTYDLAVRGMSRDAVKQFTMMNSQEIKNRGGAKEINIRKEEIDSEGKTASVDYEIKFGNGQTDNYSALLQKEDGKWKVANLF